MGHAMRLAFNAAVTHWLDDGRIDKFNLENELLLGDPGLRIEAPRPQCLALVRPGPGGPEPSHIVELEAPAGWVSVPVAPTQLEEWKCPHSLFTCVALGAEPETCWQGCVQGGFDRTESYVTLTAEVPSSWPAACVVALDAVEAAGGPDAARTPVEVLPSGGLRRWWEQPRVHLEEGPGGGLAARWRVRVLDFDMPRGVERGRLVRARFQLQPR